MMKKRSLTAFLVIALALCLAAAVFAAYMPGVSARAEALPTVKADVSALENEGNNRRFMLFFTESTLENNDSWVTGQVDQLGGLIKVNGYTLKQINEDLGGVYAQVHWANNATGQRAGLRVDMPAAMPEGKEDYPAALKADAINTLEVEGGITAPSGIVLPKVYVEYKVGQDLTSTVENARVFSTDLLGEAQGSVSVSELGAIIEPDAENYALRIYFDGKVADSLLTEQGRDYYIANYIRINDTLLKDIHWSARSAAIDAHWFVDDEAGNGYLAIYIKKDIAEAYGIRNDGSDTLEVLAGMRTPKNQAVEASGRFVFSEEGAWVEDGIEVSSAVAEQADESGNYYVYVTFDRSAANAANAEQEIDKTAILLNGKALSEIEGCSAIYRPSEEGGYVLRLRLPAAAFSGQEDSLTVKAGFEVPQSYRVKADASVSVGGFAPVSEKSNYDVKDDAISDLSVKLTMNGKALVSVKCGENTLTGEEYALSGETLTVKGDYIRALGIGKHTFTVETYGGTCSFSITVEKAEVTDPGSDGGNEEEPGGEEGGTGCSSSAGAFAAGGAAAALLACAALGVFLRKREQNK